MKQKFKKLWDTQKGRNVIVSIFIICLFVTLWSPMWTIKIERDIFSPRYQNGIKKMINKWDEKKLVKSITVDRKSIKYDGSYLGTYDFTVFINGDKNKSISFWWVHQQEDGKISTNYDVSEKLTKFLGIDFTVGDENI